MLNSVMDAAHHAAIVEAAGDNDVALFKQLIANTEEAQPGASQAALVDLAYTLGEALQFTCAAGHGDAIRATLESPGEDFLSPRQLNYAWQTLCRSTADVDDATARTVWAATKRTPRDDETGERVPGRTVTFHSSNRWFDFVIVDTGALYTGDRYEMERGDGLFLVPRASAWREIQAMTPEAWEAARLVSGLDGRDLFFEGRRWFPDMECERGHWRRDGKGERIGRTPGFFPNDPAVPSLPAPAITLAKAAAAGDVGTLRAWAAGGNEVGDFQFAAAVEAAKMNEQTAAEGWLRDARAKGELKPITYFED